MCLRGSAMKEILENRVHVRDFSSFQNTQFVSKSVEENIATGNKRSHGKGRHLK